MRKRLIAGNWKMHKTVQGAVNLVEDLLEAMQQKDDLEVLLCVPFTALVPVKEAMEGSSLQLGAQNMYVANEGAFTGEISPVQLIDAGANYVIVGHSERREIFGEDDALINEKVKAALRMHITPILCVGETLQEREMGQALARIREQLEADLLDLQAEQVVNLVIAYEPIWAIGTGETATAAQAEAICHHIRKVLASLYDDTVADQVRILYGGSVKGENAKEILSQSNIDGALVGGASLTVGGFLPILEA